MKKNLFSKTIFYLGCLRPCYLTPDLEVASIANINPDFLESIGIKGLAFDVDLTLAGYKKTKVDLIVANVFTELIKRFESYIVSNTNPERKRKLEEYFGLPAVQTHVKKPFPEPFEEALERLGTEPAETAMIGDRPLMDIAGANRVGMYTIKAGPLRLISEPKHHTLIRIIETSFLRFYQKARISEKTYLANQS